MKITDMKQTVEIQIRRWNGNGYDPDWSEDYFEAGALPYDDYTGVYLVPDVDYCIEMAKSTSEDGACVRFDEDGNCYPDEDMCVFVDGILED